ncbi:MAG: ABC transporter permease [Methylocystaceae bacterium]|nr:ABC transporter permease [Methylocystaceae bacterium]
MKNALPFEWIVAVRFLYEGRMQTLFIISGIAIGVGVIVFMSAVLTGVQANFLKRVLTTQPQIQVMAMEQSARPLRDPKVEIEDAIIQKPIQRVVSIDQWQSILQQLRTQPDIVTVSPTVSGSAFVIRGEASRSVTLTGIEPDTYFEIVKIPEYLVAGDLRLNSDMIMIGIELANDLGAKVGDKLNVNSALGGRQVLTVSALLDFGNKGANQRSTFVGLRTAQSLLGMIGGVTTLDVTVQDIYAAEMIAQHIAASNKVVADSWIKTNAQFFSAVQAQKSTNTLIRLFVGLSVAFGIAAVLVVSVIQRSKEVGILRAMGTTRGQIMRVFLLQGGLLGFAGSVVGAILGTTALIYWHALARQADGSEIFPLIIENQLFVYTAVLATATGLLAATAPALRAAKLDPVVAIRG